MFRLLLILAAYTLPTFAYAHVGVGDTQGFAHGSVHPLGGIDHSLIMVAVGVLATQLGGRALWLVPLSFLSMMILGGTLSMSGVEVPFVEIGIGLSVVVLGLVVALRLNLPVMAAMALVGLFALMHGHAHGAEMPETASSIGYGLGFVLATALLHASGICLGLLIARADGSRSRRVTQLAGGAMTLAGAAILMGMV